MTRTYGHDNNTAFEAKSDAQKIAFAAIMFQAAKALRDFGILKFLKKQKKGALLADIAREAGISEYGSLVLLEAGLSMEMVMVKDDLYFLTKTGYYIAFDELTKVNMDFTHDVNYQGFFHLQEAIKEEKPAGLQNEFGSWPTVYEALADMPEQFRKSWFAFDHFYSDNAFPHVMPILFKNSPKRILDVGGNTGKFSIYCAEHDPHIEITILDLPGQLRDAEKNIAARGFLDRIHLYPINLLDFSQPYPKGHDIVWMSQFLDCFSEDQIVNLVSNARDALDEKGELYIMETLWDKQKFEASTYCLHATSLYFTCLANGNSRMYHSHDMKRLVEKAGLRVIEEIDEVGITHTILRCGK